MHNFVMGLIIPADEATCCLSKCEENGVTNWTTFGVITRF